MSWTKSVGLSLKFTTCCIMDVITKTSLSLSPIFDENGDSIPLPCSIKLLGVTISNDMRWNDHVANVIKRASKRMYVLRNLKKSSCPVGVMKMVYIAFIRTIL